MSLRFKADSFRKKMKNVKHRLSPGLSEAKPNGIQLDGTQTNSDQSQRCSFQTHRSSLSTALDNIPLTRVMSQDNRSSSRVGVAKTINDRPKERAVRRSDRRLNGHIFNDNPKESPSGSRTAKYLGRSSTQDEDVKMKDKEDSSAHSGAESTKPMLKVSNSAKKMLKITPQQEALLKKYECTLLEMNTEQDIEFNKQILEDVERLRSAEDDILYAPDTESLDGPTTWSDIRATIKDHDSECELSDYTDKDPINDYKFKEWPDYDLELQRKVIEKYDNGDRLWTKAGLRLLEDEVEGKHPFVSIPAYAGDSNPVVKQEDLSNHKIIAEFHGYQALAFPPATRPDNMPYRSVSLKTIKFDHEDNMAESDIWVWRNCYKRAWRDNPIAFELHAMFMRLPLPPIDKIMCFDLGPVAVRSNVSSNETSRSIYRHLAALTLFECLRKRFDAPIRLLSQDPKYYPDCVRMLPEHGFEIVGTHGAAGLAEIDDRTLVFAPNPSFCLKEIVADIAQPAAMFWNTVLTPEEADLKTRSKNMESLNDNKLLSYYHTPLADPDSPRVRELVRGYDKHFFPVNNLFGKCALYTRSSGASNININSYSSGVAFRSEKGKGKGKEEPAPEKPSASASPFAGFGAPADASTQTGTRRLREDSDGDEVVLPKHDGIGVFQAPPEWGRPRQPRGEGDGLDSGTWYRGMGYSF